MNTDILEEIGFSMGEVRVYLALLELGQTTIGPLSKKANITPAKVYLILDKLNRKGLSTYIMKNNIKNIQAAHVSQMIHYIDEKKRKLEEKKKDINLFLLAAESKQKQNKEIQTAQIYQTFTGIKSMYNEALKTLTYKKEDFIAFASNPIEYTFPELLSFFQEYEIKMKHLGIKIKLLASLKDKELMSRMKKQDKNIEVRYIKHKLPEGVIIFGDSVATLIWQEVPMAFVINSAKNAEGYKNFFEDMWKIAER